MINHNFILEDGTPSTLADIIDNKILPYTSENVQSTNNTIGSIIYPVEEGEEYYFSLTTEYKINDKVYSKEPDEVLLFLNKPIIGAEYRSAFQKARLHNFTEGVSYDSDNKVYVDDDPVVEIGLVEAFNYGYLKPFMLFIQNRFIFWTCITYIHSINGDYLRILDNNGLSDSLYCNTKWTKMREITEGFGDDRTYVIKVSEEEPYYITDEDVKMITLSVDIDYADDLLETSNRNKIINEAELIFNRDGYLITASEASTTRGVCAYIADIKKDIFIRTSWGATNDDSELSLSEYINKGKKIYFEDLIVFKTTGTDNEYELFVGDESSFETTEELIEKESEGYVYVLMASTDLLFPISLKDEFITPENITDDSFNAVLSISGDKDTYSEILQEVLSYNRNLLRSENKDIISEIFILDEDQIEKISSNDYIMSMPRYKADLYETFVMIFCDGLLLENYNTIEYTLDGFTLQFSEELCEQYKDKEFEIIYFKRIDNTYATYENILSASEAAYGYELSSETDAENLKLFVQRSREEVFPYIEHNELTQYELDYDLKTIDINYNLFEIVDGEQVDVGVETIPTNFAKLKSEYYYIKPVTFVSDRQFRYNCVKFTTEDVNEFRYEFDEQFKYCRDIHKFMVFYNGLFITRDKYYLVFPDSNTPFNSTSIYLKFACEPGSRLEVFYVPNRLTELTTSTEDDADCKLIKSNEETYSNNIVLAKYIKDDELVYPLANDLCFIFRDGIKIPINKIFNIGTNRICFTDIYSAGSEFTIYRHSYDVNEEYIQSINTEECLYETLLDSYEETCGGDPYQLDGGFFDVDLFDSTVYTSSDTVDEMEEADVAIFDRIILDYYMQPGTHLDRSSIPLKIEVFGDPVVNRYGIYTLYSIKTDVEE